MKLFTKTIRKLAIASGAIIAVIAIVMAGASYTYAAKKSSTKDDTFYKERALANVFFYDDDCVGGGNFGSLCGDTVEEKVWSILRQTFDPLHAAAAFGSIAHEGSFQPVKWEHFRVADPSTGQWMPGITWDDLYNGVYDGTYGVGSFGLTSGLSDYLHYVNDNAPDLLQYFKDPSNTLYEYSTGDDLAEKIGQSEVDRLLDLEVNYFINEWIPKYKGQGIYDSFLESTDLEEAAIIWARDIEVCTDCGCDICASSTQLPVRVGSAKEFFTEYKDFTCSGGSGSKASSAGSASSGSSSVGTSSVSGKDITWIGDSDSALAHDEEGDELIQRTFPGVDYGPEFNQPGSYIQSGKFISGDDDSNIPGLVLLENIIKQDKLRPYLVFALGGNGGWNDEEMERFLDLISSKDVQVILTTTKYLGGMDYTGSNEIVKKAAAENPNIYVADVAANYKDEYFDESDIEFNAEGGKMFVRTIKEALEEASGNGNCTTYTGDYPEYLQGDSRWGNKPYGPEIGKDSNGNPIYSDYYYNGACGATAMATIATIASGTDVFPDDVGDLLGDQYYYNNPGTAMESLNKKVCEKYGCEVEMVSYTPGEAGLVDKLRQSLKDGWMILTSGGCDDGGAQNGHGPTCPYSRGGHYVAILGLKDNDTAIVSDPGWDGITEYKLADLAAGLKAEAYSIIRGNGKGGGSCANYCGNTSSGVNGGITDEQAQKIADYYNGPDVDGSKLPFGKMNCVSFSMWFVEYFTDLAWGGGDGRDVAHSLATANDGLEEGNEPRPFAIFSVTSVGIKICDDGFKCGHTGIVVSVDGDEVTAVEAALDTYDAKIVKYSKSDLSNQKYGKTYTYLSDKIDSEKMNKIIGK